MEKQWWFIFVIVLILGTSGESQTLLNSFEIPLQRPNNLQSIQVGVNEINNEITAFLGDKYKVTAVLFNQAVFFKDSLSTIAPDKKVGTMVGTGFAKNQHPMLFYASEDFKRIHSILFDFNRRATIKKTYELPLETENVVHYFSDKNAFSMITVVIGRDLMKWYYFKDNVLEVIILNLEEVAKDFKDRPSQSLHQFFEIHPFEKIDNRIFNPLFFSCSKSKLYATEKGLMLTFDQRKDATKLITVNREEEVLEHFHYAVPKLDYQNYDSNSYLIDGYLFQIAANKKELALTVMNFNNKEVVKTYRVLEKENIDFANSDLMLLVDGQSPRTFRKTKPFLSSLNDSDLGVSVHTIRNQYHVQLGGRKWVMSSGDYLFGVLSAVAGLDDFGTNWNNAKMMYFDTLFDEEFNYVKSGERRFSQDYVSFFVYDEKINLMAPTVYYQDALLLAYYDRKEQRLMLRKFEDDLY